jgi:hypothetical protein
MKEKHSTETSNNLLQQQCIYCLENSQHPRLGRGEQYKCGYKPYRCDICDYSTTTKGNLSIHMQSDKHMNNIKDGGTTTTTTTVDNTYLINKFTNEEIAEKINPEISEKIDADSSNDQSSFHSLKGNLA